MEFQSNLSSKEGKVSHYVGCSPSFPLEGLRERERERQTDRQTERDVLVMATYLATL